MIDTAGGGLIWSARIQAATGTHGQHSCGPNQRRVEERGGGEVVDGGESDRQIQPAMLRDGGLGRRSSEPEPAVASTAQRASPPPRASPGN